MTAAWIGCGSSESRDAAVDLTPRGPDLIECGMTGDPTCPCNLNGGEDCSKLGEGCDYFEFWSCTCEAQDAGPPRWHCVDTNPQRYGCNGYIACLNNCANGDTACSNQCKANTSANGLNIYNKALFCGQSYCLGLNDMGSGECMLSADMTKLVDKTGGPVNGCNACLDNALAALFVLNCNPTSSPDCNPAQCTAAVTACANSTP